jgi:hypothetical protein
MKKFRFPLARVMDWRHTQARIEETRLEQTYAEQRGIDARETTLKEQRLQAQTAVLGAASVTGEELAALHAFRRFTVAEHTRLEQLRADCSRRIAIQIQVVASKRRELRLLERLKQQRFKAWEQEYSREIDAQADEAHLAKWRPAR